MTSSLPDPVDLHVGERLKLRRLLRGMSQESLGEMLGVTFQQIQKYERGVNRIGSSRLFAIGQILETPISWFFDDLAEEPTPQGVNTGLSEARSGFVPQVPRTREPTTSIDQRETLDLVRAYHRITDPIIRQRFIELAKALAAVSGRRPDTA